MSDLTIIPRREWGALPRNGTVIRRPPDSIHTLVIHWPGEPGSLRAIDTDREERAKLRAWQRFHMYERGWADLGYNLVLFPNWGRRRQPCNVYGGRGARYIPAAQSGANTGTLAVMVALGTTDPLTADVKARLRSVVRWAEDYAGHELRVRPHRSYGGTSCPGDQLAAYIPTLDRI